MVGKSDNVEVPPIGTRSKDWYREYDYPTVLKGYSKNTINLGQYGTCESDYIVYFYFKF